MKIRLACFCVFAALASLHARVDLLLVPPTAVVRDTRNLELTLHINNPSDEADTVYLPRDLTASYASLAGRGTVAVEVVEVAEHVRTVDKMSRLTVTLRVKDTLPAGPGFVSVRLVDPQTNVIMFDYRPAVDAPRVFAAPRPGHEAPTRDIDLATDIEAMRRHVSGLDPVYLAVGGRERLNARLQLSFKFRVFEAGLPEEPLWMQLGRGMHVGYTQTSIWDLESFSKPFYDSSYKPTAFVLHERRLGAEHNGLLTILAGAQHESNGQGGSPEVFLSADGLASAATSARHPSDSRSLNSLYFAPRLRWDSSAGWFVEAGARVMAYFQIDENPDIARYRGHVELTLRGGQARGRQLSVHLRGSALAGRGSVEFNYTWPVAQTVGIGRWLPESLGGYGQIQYFNGYGESLLDYDVRRRDQLRFGVMIAR